MRVSGGDRVLRRGGGWSAEVQIVLAGSFSPGWPLADRVGGELCYLLLRNDLLTGCWQVPCVGGTVLLLGWVVRGPYAGGGLLGGPCRVADCRGSLQ